MQMDHSPSSSSSSDISVSVIRQSRPSNGETGTINVTKSTAPQSSANGVSSHDSSRDKFNNKRDRGKDRERNVRPRLEESTDVFVTDTTSHMYPQAASCIPTTEATAHMYPQAASCIPTTDSSYLDGSHRPLSIMPNYNAYNYLMSPSQYGMNAAMAPAVTTSMDMSTTTAAAMAPYPYLGVPDPSMLGSQYAIPMGPYQYGLVNGDGSLMVPPEKQPLQLTKSTLLPPSPTAPPATTRERPLGCKTVFVGGLPEKASEEVMQEIFSTCGEITTIRMSKKNFCHIRFADESCVDHALYFSGYRLRIENKEEPPYSGRLHVDYAQARDDQYDYECKQRALQRMARHQQLEQERLEQTPDTTLVPYSDHEASLLGEKLRGESTFPQAAHVFITWLERGECNKRTAGYFYSMLQSTNSHVRRLMNEKLKFEEELNKAKTTLKQQMQGILLQLGDIVKVFNAAGLQKVWDHFTKAQRKNIELWKKQTEEIRNAHIEEVLNDRVEDEMELSDDEDNSGKKNENDQSSQLEKANEELKKLREENDILRCQLEAAENETALLRSEVDTDKYAKDHQVQSLIATLEMLQNELRNQKSKTSKNESPDEKKRNEGKQDKELGESSHDYNIESIINLKEIRCEKDTEVPKDPKQTSTSSSCALAEPEIKLIGLISTFLNVHPFGASIDYICSYLHQINNTIKARDVEALMKRFKSIFKEESTGIGASLEKRWTFCGFQ